MNVRAVIVLAIAFVSGCSSGMAGFVKYTPDAGYLIFDECGYIRCYVHDIANAKTYAFDGSFACEDNSECRWIVEPAPLALDKTVKLVAIQPDGGVEVTRLPPLPGVTVTSGVAATFGPGDDQISLLLRRRNSPDPNWQVFQLKSGDEAWHELTSDSEREELVKQVENRPDDSIAILGYIPPSSHSFVKCTGQNVERVKETENWAGRSYEYRLGSPHGKTFVTIRAEQPAPIWARGTGELTLTDVSTGKSRVLMTSTDLLYRLFQNWIYGPIVFPFFVIGMSGV